MNISLTPTFERHIREKIESGLYGNASEVVREALRRMIETERKDAGPASTPVPAPVRPAPHRDVVIPRLAALEPELRKEGVTALRLVGSVARGEARPDSDVDVLIDVAPEADKKFSLMDIAGLHVTMTEALGHETYPQITKDLPPDMRERMTADAITVFE